MCHQKAASLDDLNVNFVRDTCPVECFNPFPAALRFPFKIIGKIKTTDTRLKFFVFHTFLRVEG